MTPTRYENISEFEQHGLAPGETGELDLTKEEAERLVARGALKVVGGTQSPSEPAKQPEGGTPPGGKR